MGGGRCQGDKAPLFGVDGRAVECVCSPPGSNVFGY